MLNNFARKTGSLVGKGAFRIYKQFGEHKAEQTRVIGESNVLNIPKEVPIIFTGNYCGPSEYYGRSGLPYEYGCGFLPSPAILLNIFSKIRDKDISAVIASGMDSINEEGLIVPANLTITRLRESFYLGAGLIPVDNSKEGKDSIRNVSLFKEAKSISKDKDILIFAEGKWRDNDSQLYDFLPHMGPATLAYFCGAIIVPFYHRGGEAWTHDEKSSLLKIGVPIAFNQLEGRKANILNATENIRTQIISLQNEQR